MTSECIVEAADRQKSFERKRVTDIAKTEGEVTTAEKSRGGPTTTRRTERRVIALVMPATTQKDGASMTLNSEDELLKNLNVPSLKAPLPEKFPEILMLIPDLSDELRLKVLDQVPGFIQFALESMNTLEETLQATTAAIGSEQKQLHDSFADLRRILAERLQTPGISESHAEFVIDKMIEMQREEKGQSNDTNKLIAEQADATRLSKMLNIALPLVVTAIAAGAQIAINRRGPGAFKI